MTINPEKSISESKGAALQSTYRYPLDYDEMFMHFQFYDYQAATTEVSTDNRSGLAKGAQAGAGAIVGGVLGNLVGIPGVGAAIGGGVGYTGTDNIINSVSKFFESDGLDGYNANKQKVINKINKSTWSRVALPIPSQLNDVFSLQYKSIDLAPLPTGVLDVMGVHSDQVKSDLSTTASDFAGVMARSTLEGISPSVSATRDLILGNVINPNLAAIFEGPQLKDHQFTWRLAARNKDESEQIAHIIGVFKRAALPKRDGTFFLKFPSECFVEFVVANKSNSRPWIYPIRPCVITQVAINYSPDKPTFFVDTKEPTIIELTVQLRETTYYTKDTFTEGSGEIGNDGLTGIGTGAE